MAKTATISRIQNKSKTVSSQKAWTQEMAKLLAVAMLMVESEIEVEEIIAGNPHMSNPDNWIPVARSENNIATVNNQSVDPTKALGEMVTNMVDAILMRLATQKGIDPRGYDAPQSIAEGVETLLGWKEGRMTNAFNTMHKATAWATKNMQIAFTGNEKNSSVEPTLVFCDSGEGQHPQDFDRTFMSLGDGGGKRDIKFVQGQYNQGSSGVLGFCGRNGYKLVLSRKHTLDGEWGWSLVRRRPNYDRIVYEYFKVGGLDGFIPSFKADSMDMVYDRNGSPIADTNFKSGTAIKLFNYRIGGNYESFDGTRRVFYEHLANSVLPIRLLNVKVASSDKKDKKRAQGVDARTFCGLEIHISQALANDQKAGHHDDADNETTPTKGARVVDVGEITDPAFGSVSVKAYFTEDEITKTSKSTKAGGCGYIRSTNRAFYSVNGQIQHREGRGFLTECGFPALKDRMALIIDCSNLSIPMHQTIWKSDREAMHIGKDEAKNLLKKIKDHVADCQELKDLNSEVQEQAMSRMINNTAEAVFSKLAKHDPTLARLLTGGSPIKAAIRLEKENQNPNADAGRETTNTEAYVGSYSPTFFRIAGIVGEKYRLQRGKHMTLHTKTDAVNDYFIRQKDRGVFTISEELSDIGLTTARGNLKDGSLAITFKAPENAPLGLVPVVMTLRDRSMGRKSAPVTLEFNIEVVEAVAPTDRPTPEKREKKGIKITTPHTGFLTCDGRDIEIDGTVVKSKEWPEGWDERDGAHVENTNDDQLMININFDNIHLQERLATTPMEDKRKLFEKFKIAMQLSCMATQQQINHVKETQPEFTVEAIDLLRRNSAAAAASTALTLVDTLPKIMKDNSSADSDE